MERIRITFLVLAVLVAAGGIYGVKTSANGNVNGNGSEANCNYMYKVGNDTQRPCILANMEISLAVQYKTKADETKTAQYNVTKNTTNVVATGTCSPVMSELVLTWGKGKSQNSVKFVLFNNETTFSVVHVAFNVSLSDAEAEVNRVQNSTDLAEGLFSENVQNISVCTDSTKIPIYNSIMTVSKIELIAFNSDDKYCQRNKSEKQCSKGKVFSYDISKEGDQISNLATMSISLEIPYTQKNGKVQLYKENFTNVATVDNTQCSNEGHSCSADLHWYSDGKKFTLSITVSIHDNDIAYIDKATVDILIDKKRLTDSKDNIRRKGTMNLRLFPVAIGNGLYSCKTGNILRFGDVKMTITNVFFAPFHTGNGFNVTMCDPETTFSARMFNYAVKDANSGVPCILGNMTIALDVTYKKKDKTKGTKTIKVPSNATTIGSCDKYMPYMDLSWPASMNETKKDKMNRLLISFYQTSGLYYADYAKADIYNDQEIFQDTVETDEWLHSISSTTLRLLTNNMVNGYYKCSDPVNATINDSTKIKISDVMLMAFNDQEDISIKVMESDCYDNKTDTDKNNGTTRPKGYNYYVFPKNSKIPCTLANMDITLNIHYATKTGTNSIAVPVPTNATSDGICGSEKSTLNIVWSNEKGHPHMVNLTFNKESSRFFLHQIDMSIDTTSFPETKGEKFKGQKDNLMLFSADASNIYNCESQEEVAGDQFTATFSKVTLIVFNEDGDYTKRSEENCSTANVGAIVGGIIGGFLIVGVIGYAVYRYRKNRYY
ncbi:uncharacterized protein LOC117226675 isoform X1 [Megalopta genalis]|uniref:uncharacterized protein LOC117226675 isoform X1 n=1 Tax=Megalopta genalis TaxID=115081 RepID=UPI003FD3CADC